MKLSQALSSIPLKITHKNESPTINRDKLDLVETSSTIDETLTKFFSTKKILSINEISS
jgi:hypothetical protein